MALARSVSTSLWGRRAEAPAPSRLETHRERISEGEAWPRGGRSLQKGVAGPLLDGPPAPRKASPSGPHTPQPDGCCSSAAAGPPRLRTERSGPPGRRPPTAPRAGLRLPRLGIALHFQSERSVCKDADSSRETPSVRPYRLPRAPKDIDRKEEPGPGGLRSHRPRGQEGSVAKFGVNYAILPCHGAASETDA